MASKTIERELQSFLTSKSQFKLLHSSNSNSIITPMTSRLLILDSSFNPPHKAHYSIIQKSIIHKFPSLNNSISTTTINDKSVLLLLSVNNADKSSNSPASTIHRLSMMIELSNEISENLGICCGVGITDKSLFIDKYKVLSEFINSEKKVTQTYLFGFDTLIRLLNPKYYQSKGIVDALNEFITNCDCFVLTRRDSSSSSSSMEHQKDYVKNLEWIPSSWIDKFNIVDNVETNLDISSSSIRESIKQGDSGWEMNTFPSIANYIKNNHIY
ncbi:hypothetical protein CANARDRAFT_5637 [[Candida] arabinofermentans NRRL YB-2248]|uniref:Nicotinamide-nucleotide adenylyltransferase n=1 Tax=[Candida] arabinofermentans NRRL YB-2248 TaxID=983967 RepID=A0A1E4T5P2_9ASCO|nr:hypothetical protein CANARDRAFT_5637 [[Candida] arabinofermentans NRRL YB-2248]